MQEKQVRTEGAHRSLAGTGAGFRQCSQAADGRWQGVKAPFVRCVSREGRPFKGLDHVAR